MICDRHLLQNTYLVVQNADHATDIINGVAVDDNDRRSEVQRRT
jgi:hypothetical protein